MSRLCQRDFAVSGPYNCVLKSLLSVFTYTQKRCLENTRTISNEKSGRANQTRLGEF